MITESSFVTLMQTSISPAILISAVGLILLSLTNRFGRVIDRSRILHAKIALEHKVDPEVAEQLAIITKRARIIRYSISFAVLSILGTTVLTS
jgi:hypothetical protein